MLLAAMIIEIVALVMKVVQFARGKKSFFDDLKEIAQWLMPVICVMRYFSQVNIPGVDEFIFLYACVVGGMAAFIILVAGLYAHLLVDYK